MARPVLASDTERELCAARLRHAATEGRIDVPELEQRLGAAYGARTRLDLAELTADLPQPPARRRRTPATRFRRLVALGATGNAAVGGLWLADLGPQRDLVIFGITNSDLVLPFSCVTAWVIAVVAIGWRRRREVREPPDTAVALS